MSPRQSTMSSSSTTTTTPPVRRHGRVTYYNSKPNQQYGFITDLGVLGDTTSETVGDRIYFHRSFVRSMVPRDSPRALVQFSINTIVEYVLETHINDDDEESYRAKDITGLYEMALPFHAGIVTFTPYNVAMRKRARDDVSDGQRRFEHITRRLEAVTIEQDGSPNDDDFEESQQFE